MKHALASMAGLCLAIGCSGEGGGGGGPAAPSNLIAAPMGGGVHLTWKDNSADEDVFEIERKVAEGNAGFAALDTVPFDSSLYHDAAVTLGTTYAYRVRARRGTATSAYSNEAAADPGGGQAGTTGSGGGGGTGTGAGGTAGSATAGSNGTAGSTGGTTGTAGRGGTTGSAGSSAGAGRGGTTGSAGSSASAGRGGTGGTSAAAVSFKRDVAPSLVQTCGSTTVGCHNNDQAVGRIMPQYGPCKVIWFSAVDGPVGATFYSGPSAGQSTGCPDLNLYDRLLQLHSMLCDGSTWSARASYVVPGDLQRSLLYQVIAGDASFGGKCTANGAPVGRMPKIDPAVLPNGAPLTADKIQKIADWIMQGAPNN